MKKTLTIIAFLYFVQSIGYSGATIQRWLPNTNFETPNNWNAKRAPCGNDIAIIPDESPVVYLQMNTTLKELVLPKTGEVILGPNVKIGFTQTASSRCPSVNGDVEFTAVNPKSWVNPSNWCNSPTEQGSCDVTTPKLDVERVPCAFDDVVMPRYKSFYIDLSEQVPALTIKSLKIAGTSFTTSSFQTYLTGQDGRRMFKTANQPSSTTRVAVTRKGCDDKRGCACGNDVPQIAQTICKHVEKTCGRPKCKHTIKPVGACCRMCGAVFNITRGYGFDNAAFKTTITSDFYTDEVKKDMNMTIYVTYDGIIQMVLNDRTGEKSAALAGRIKRDMEEDISKGGHKYAVDGVKLMLSMASPLGPPSAHSGDSMSSGSVVGIVIGLLLILAILVLVTIFFVFKRTGREVPKMPSLSIPTVSMPSLPRLPRRTPKATARVPAQPHTAPHVDPGFANPLYDTSPFDDGNAVVKEMELMPSEEQPTFGISAGGGFNNPLYGEQGAANMFHDPTKSTDSPSSRRDDPSSTSASAAMGCEKGTAVTPSSDASAQMVLVDINDDKDSTI